MSKNNFSPTGSIAFGWNKFKENPKFWIVVAAIMMLVGGGGGGNFNLNGLEGDDTYPRAFENNASNEVNLQINNNMLYEGGELTPEMMMQMQQQQMELMEEGMMMQEEGNTIQEVLGTYTQNPEQYEDYGAIAAILGGFALLYAIPLGIAFFVLSIVVGVSLQMGYIRLTLDAVRGKKLAYETILSEVAVKNSIKLFLISIVYGIFILIGLLFFIIPGIYIAIKYTFFVYEYVDNKGSTWDAFKRSGNVTKGAMWKMLGFAILVTIVMIIGLLAFGVGIFAAAPVVAIATAKAYDTLKNGSTGEMNSSDNGSDHGDHKPQMDAAEDKAEMEPAIAQTGSLAG